MTKKFIGYHEDADLPLKKGDTVTIRKGTPIRTTSPKGSDQVAGRTYKVRVDHVLNGITISEIAGIYGRAGAQKNPSARWVGTGGYWFEVDINDIPEATRE